MLTATDRREVAILDARKRDLDYEACGFTLRPLRSNVTDWQDVAVSGSRQQRLFESELEAVIRGLHPDVKKIRFTGDVLRGGAGSNPPLADATHLDFYPDMERVRAAEGDRPEGSSESPPPDELEGLEMKMVLGLWMPREMRNPVHDYPLVLGDASTFEFEDVVPQMTDLYVIADGEKQRARHLMAAPPIFSSQQRWYYYNQQTCEEVVIFRHLTKPARGKACFHAAFKQPLPDGAESRKSVESRAYLYF
jgi:hypothetical protein